MDVVCPILPHRNAALALIKDEVNRDVITEILRIVSIPVSSSPYLANCYR